MARCKERDSLVNHSEKTSEVMSWVKTRTSAKGGKSKVGIESKESK